MRGEGEGQLMPCIRDSDIGFDTSISSPPLPTSSPVGSEGSMLFTGFSTRLCWALSGRLKAVRARQSRPCLDSEVALTRDAPESPAPTLGASPMMGKPTKQSEMLGIIEIHIKTRNRD